MRYSSTVFVFCFCPFNPNDFPKKICNSFSLPFPLQPQQYQQQGPRHGDHYNYQNHYNENINPAWRGISEHYRQPLTTGPAPVPPTGSGTGMVPGDRYLYDPRNPKKPIPAQRGSGVRFPMDPRFAPPQNAGVTVGGNSGPVGGGSGPTGPPGPPRMSGYRPPFPPTSTSASSSSMITGSSTETALTAGGGEAAQILGKNKIRKIYYFIM